jgi:hypothetical protein
MKSIFCIFLCCGVMMIAPQVVGAETKAAGVILRCQGYNRALKDTIAHDIVLTGSSALVDGQQYAAVENATSYTLTPVRGIGLAGLYGDEIHIDRINGSYNFLGSDGQSPDWSRPTDAGCKLVKAVF